MLHTVLTVSGTAVLLATTLHVHVKYVHITLLSTPDSAQHVTYCLLA